MTTQRMLEIAMEQSAEDMGCLPEDFLGTENVVRPFRMGQQARKYLEEPITCSFVSYGNNVVVGAAEEVRDLAEEYVRKFEFFRCFETPNLHWLNDRLMPRGHKICFMAEYYLPGSGGVPELSCPYEMRLLGPQDFGELYRPEWGNALCEKRRELDVLGVGAYDRGKLIGLAGCSADCEEMWQIGIDVLPEYRRQGVASALTSALAREIVRRGKVPFYCSAWSNLRSMRNALRSGFVPAWVEMTVKPTAVVEEMNR